MKLTIVIICVISLSLVLCCTQKNISTPENALDEIKRFKSKEKFQMDLKLPYPGISDPNLKPLLTNKINVVADHFHNLALKETASVKQYQEAIKIGLKSFQDVYQKLDTEDRERICSYFEELMDIVELKSSNGQLNKFMYGFDPETN